MAIKILPNGVQIGSFTLEESATGLTFDGAVLAASTEEVIYTFGGAVSGYSSGGSGAPTTNIIDKFPFASDGNATDVGDLTQGRFGAAGQSSDTSGYSSGGYLAPLPPGGFNTIDKFPFAADANATDVGDLLLGRFQIAGQSSGEFGYTTGGGRPGPILYNTIEKFPFASDANSADVGDMTLVRYNFAGQSSQEQGYGYNSGGFIPTPTDTNVIDKFPFASDANATDVGDLTEERDGISGQSSITHGYSSGGAPGVINIIDKFPFATNANATDVGDLTQGRYATSGQSSRTFGYISGGYGPPPITNIIEKFPFAADANATDVGDLTRVSYLPAGQQI